MKKEMQSMSRECSRDKLLRASNGFEQKRTTTTTINSIKSSLNSNSKNTAAGRNFNGQNKFFVYVNQSADENVNPSTTQNPTNEAKHSLPFKSQNQQISAQVIQSRQPTNLLNQSNNSANLVLRKLDSNGRTTPSSSSHDLPLNVPTIHLNDPRMKQIEQQQQQFDSSRTPLNINSNNRNYHYQMNQCNELDTHGSNSTNTLTYQNSSCYNNNVNFLSYGFSQYYLLNIHHIIKIQRFAREHFRQNQQERRGQEINFRQRRDNNNNNNNPSPRLHPSLAQQSSVNNNNNNNNNNTSFQKHSILPDDSLNGISKSTFNNYCNFSSNPSVSNQNESNAQQEGIEESSMGNVNNLKQNSSYQRLSQIGRKLTNNLIRSSTNNNTKNNTVKQGENNNNSNSSGGSLNELEAISFGAQQQQQATTSRNDRTFEDEFEELNEAKNYINHNANNPSNQQAYGEGGDDDDYEEDEQGLGEQIGIRKKERDSVNIDNMQVWFEQEQRSAEQKLQRQQRQQQQSCQDDIDGQDDKQLRLLEHSKDRFLHDNKNNNNLRSTSLTESSASASKPNNSPMDGLKQENTQLKKIVFQMKLDMKSQLEEGLVAQRSQMQAITQEYVQFIEKIVSDKKELTKRCEQLILDNSSVVKGSEVDELKAEIVEHINRENEISREKDQFQQQLIAERNALNNKIETLNQQIIGLSKEKQQIKEENDKEQQVFKQQIEGLAQENHILREKNEELELKAVQLIREIETANDNTIKSHKCFEEQMNELTDMHTQRIEQYESITRQLNQEVGRLQEQHAGDLEMLERERAGWERQVEMSRSRVEKLEAEIVEEIRLRQVNEEISQQLREQILSLERKLEVAITEKEQLRQKGEEAVEEEGSTLQKRFETETEGENKAARQNCKTKNFQSSSSNYDTNNNNNHNSNSKADELEILISQIDDERKQACEMVKKMKEAHELLRNKYEDEVKMLKDRHTVEFCEYEENIRSSLQKKDLSISKLHMVIDSLKGLLAAHQIE